jgi:hypothetical protein
MKSPVLVASFCLLAAWGLLQAAGGLSAAEEREGAMAPAAFSIDANKTRHVFYRTAGGDILELYSKTDQEGWNRKDLTAEAKAPKSVSNPAAYFQKNKTQHVVYRGDDGQIHELYLADNQDKWGRNNISAAAKGTPTAVGDPRGYATDHGTQHIVFRTAEGDIFEVYNVAEGADKGWHGNNLTNEAKAPKAAGNPAAYTQMNKTRHVIYRGEDDLIHELYLADKQKQWEHKNVSAAVKETPKAAGDPCGFAGEGDTTQHVVFRTAEGDIFELYNVAEGANKGWHGNNLTNEAKASKAAGNPAEFTQKNKTQHVIYRGEDDQIHELYLADRQGKWTHKNLSATVKDTPKATGDPCGFAAQGDKTQHVVFNTADGGIFELYNIAEGSGKGWHGNNISASAKK